MLIIRNLKPLAFAPGYISNIIKKPNKLKLNRVQDATCRVSDKKIARMTIAILVPVPSYRLSWL